nr:splicing factor U2af large subunit B [Tanacetum cinerariifolium]
MMVVRFYCSFVGLSRCHDGGGNGLTKTSLIIHLRDRHCMPWHGFFCVTPDSDDGVVRFVVYDLTRPQVPSCFEHLNHVEDLLCDQHGGFTLALLDNLFKGVACCQIHSSQVSLEVFSSLEGSS